MRINEQFQKDCGDREEEKKLSALILKLEKFARKQFYLHWFRGTAAGIPPSGDDYTDFVIRAFIHCLPADGKFKIDQKIINKLYQYIFREVSRESRLKINNLIKNETDYGHDHPDDESYQNPVQLAQNNEISVRERISKKESKRIINKIMTEFRQYIKDEKYNMIVELFNSPKTCFDRMITKVTDHPIVLINELINDNWILDFSGQTTEHFDRIDRPCKLKVKTPLKGKRAKSDLYGILKSNGKPSQPRFIAYPLGMTVEKYQLHVRKIREQFAVFLNQWKTKGNNEEKLKVLGLFQDYI